MVGATSPGRWHVPRVGVTPPASVAHSWGGWHVPGTGVTSLGWVSPRQQRSPRKRKRRRKSTGWRRRARTAKVGASPHPCPLTPVPIPASLTEPFPFPGKPKKPGGKKWDPDEEEWTPPAEKKSECPHSWGDKDTLLGGGSPSPPTPCCPQGVPQSGWSPTALRMTRSWPPPCCVTGWVPSAAASTCR